MENWLTFGAVTVLGLLCWGELRIIRFSLERLREEINSLPSAIANARAIIST